MVLLVVQAYRWVACHFTLLQSARHPTPLPPKQRPLHGDPASSTLNPHIRMQSTSSPFKRRLEGFGDLGARL